MDKVDILEKYAKAKFEHGVAKRNLKERIEAELHITHNGGMWRASPELIVLCNSCEGTVVLEDLYNTPVSVDSNELCTLAIQRWQEQMNAWQTEYKEISKNR